MTETPEGIENPVSPPPRYEKVDKSRQTDNSQVETPRAKVDEGSQIVVSEGYVPPPRFDIVGTKDTDSRGSIQWQDYLDGDKLSNAWEPPEESPYRKFFKDKTIRSIDAIRAEIKPRYSEGEVTSEKGIQTPIDSGIVGHETGVILDSGGAHSVAMAVKLVEHGYQPVVMFDTEPHPQGSNRAEQELATLLYFAEQMDQLRQRGIIKADAPPVFILDTHRSDAPNKGDVKVDNTYTYTTDDFPTSDELRQQGITKIVYVNEGDQKGKINTGYQSSDRLAKDIKPIAHTWEAADIDLLYTGVAPWKETERADSPFFSSRSRFQQPEKSLSYPDMPVSVYGDSSGIAMHKDRQRFILTQKGELMVLNESGISRDPTSDELSHFRSEIERQIASQSENQTLQDLYKNFPKREE